METIHASDNDDVARDAPNVGDSIRFSAETTHSEEDLVDLLAMQDEILAAEAAEGVHSEEGDFAGDEEGLSDDDGESDEVVDDALATEVEGHAVKPERGVASDDGSEPEEDSVERASRLSRLAQRGEIGRDFLEANEIPPGHTLDKHIGKTDESLRERLATSRVNAASTFHDFGTAERAVARVLRERSSDIDRWVDDDVSSRLTLNMDVGIVVGRVMSRTGPMQPSSKVTVVLHRSPYGYQIMTAYPT